MDIDLFRDGEQFSTFDSRFLEDEYPDDSTSLDGMHDFGSNVYEWEMENEREINGDLALIPMSSNFNSSLNDLSASPPSRDDFTKIISDWQQFINIDHVGENFPDDPIITPEENQDETAQQRNSTSIDKFNLHSDYIPDPTSSIVGNKAANLNDNSCITTFINASEILDRVEDESTFDIASYINDECKESVPKPPAAGIGMKKIDLKAQRYIVEEDEDDVDVETISEAENSPVLEAGDLKSLLEQFEATEIPPCNITPALPIQDELKETKSDSTTSLTSDTIKNKQILDSLPQELIARIKESGKRKPISVIPPIPSKKRGGTRIVEAAQQKLKIVKPQTSLNNNNNETIKLDHDYCSLLTPYPKHPKKDSGFESAEEDDRTIIKNQPMVKNADGKLMVSLLKVNTIKSVEKKKLNLEEYKKRREGFTVKTKLSSTISIANVVTNELEDENLKIQKHQEKLMKMAKEVLSTPAPNADKKTIEQKQTKAVATKIKQEIVVPAPLLDMEMKTLVSVGVNTDPITDNVELEDIKPLLQKVNAKFNCNSLITSLIENLPKAMQAKTNAVEEKRNEQQHGEDKTIVYLPRNRTAIKTCSVDVQTNISLIKEIKQNRYRRRRSSSSTSSFSSDDCSRSSRYSRRRKRSVSSTSSYRSSRSSSSSSSYCSRSRSRSPRPIKKSRSMEREHIREVEERRVIYVGRITANTTRDDLKKRFNKFGTITNVSLHFRDHGDNYGFVTFANKLDAYEAIEHGNDDPYLPKYDLSFGGRRLFCKTSYSDLDNVRDDLRFDFGPRVAENSFDTLLREAQEKLRKRKV